MTPKGQAERCRPALGDRPGRRRRRPPKGICSLRPARPYAARGRISLACAAGPRDVDVLLATLKASSSIFSGVQLFVVSLFLGRISGSTSINFASRLPITPPGPPESGLPLREVLEHSDWGLRSSARDPRLIRLSARVVHVQPAYQLNLLSSICSMCPFRFLCSSDANTLLLARAFRPA